MTEYRDVCFLIDATFSMQTFLQGLQSALTQFRYMLLLQSYERLSVAVYRDYDCKDVFEFSGWYQTDEFHNLTFLVKQKALGGQDKAEAAKTGFNKLLQECDRPCLIIHCTDAPPHHPNQWSCDNWMHECDALGWQNYDWIKICKDYQQAQHKVVTLMHVQDIDDATFHAVIGAFTDGFVLKLHNIQAETIRDTAINVFCTLQGYNATFEHQLLLAVDNVFSQENMHSECNCAYYLPAPPGVSTRALEQSQVTSEYLQGLIGLKTQLTSLQVTQRLRDDLQFYDRAVSVFNDILDSADISILNSNAMFGLIWRSMSTLRTDAKKSEVAQSLLNRFSKCKQKLLEAQSNPYIYAINESGGTSAQRRTKLAAMKRFVASSYDKSKEIEANVKIFTRDTPFAAYSMNDSGRMTNAEILEINRSCNQKVFSKVSNAFAHLQLHEDQIVLKDHHFLPADITNKELFSYLPYIMSMDAKAILSTRPAAVIAMIAVYTKSILAERAHDFLLSVKGKYISNESPENNSVQFNKLVTALPQYFTEEELRHAELITKLAGLQANMQTTLSVQIPFCSNRTVRADSKTPCVKCQKLTSFTLIDESGVCGFCNLDYAQPESDLKPDEAYWYQCCSCAVHYTVVKVSDLHSKPKCHMCREGLQNTVQYKKTCVECQNTFMHQLLDTSDEPQYTCPPCKLNGSVLLEHYNTNFFSFIKENGLGTLGIKTSMSPLDFCLYRHGWTSLIEQCYSDDPVQQQLTFKDKPVHNSLEVLQCIESWISKGGDSQLRTCPLCFDEVTDTSMAPSCNRKACHMQACVPCLERWYKATKPGTLCLPTNLTCPFCKQQPHAKVMRRHNKELMTLRNLQLDKFDPQFYYAWCVDCYEVKQAVERVCAHETPVLTNFRCETCTELRETGIRRKDCPGCTVLTEKISGCNHIHCTCGTHWCFECGYRGTDSGNVYSHMLATHNGYYDADRNTNEDDDEDLGEYGNDIHYGDDLDAFEDHDY